MAKRHFLLPLFTHDYLNSIPSFNKLNNLLSGDSCLKAIFSKKAYRRCPTLRDILVKSTLKSTSTTYVRHGFFHCNRHNCSTCKHFSENSSFHSYYINKTFNIHGHITCSSTNLIYIITCSKCQKQYVSKTGRKLKTRITEHFRNIRKHTNTIIGLHFNATSHTIEQGSATFSFQCAKL